MAIETHLTINSECTTTISITITGQKENIEDLIDQFSDMADEFQDRSEYIDAIAFLRAISSYYDEQ